MPFPPAPVTASAAATRRRWRYDRQRDLPRLVPLWPSQLATPTIADHQRLLARLRRALREERRRGLGGHWSYDLARHAQLLAAYRCELAVLLARPHGAAPTQPNSGAG